MLAPSPSSALPHAPRADAYTVAGEEAPAWLAVAFAAAGTLIAVMSAALWQQSLAPAVTTALSPAAPVMAVPAREVPDSAPAPKTPDTPMPEPPPIAASPPPSSTAAVAIEPAPPPVAAAAPTESRSPAKSATDCFAPLAIAFERGSTRPNPADVKRSLAILHKTLSRHADATLLIEGHTDASGSEDLNVLLSYSRAKAVAELLKRDGIPARQIAVRAAGAGEARGDADTVAGDRKAVLRLAGVDDCDQLTATKRP